MKNFKVEVHSLVEFDGVGSATIATCFRYLQKEENFQMLQR